MGGPLLVGAFAPSPPPLKSGLGGSGSSGPRPPFRLALRALAMVHLSRPLANPGPTAGEVRRQMSVHSNVQIWL